MKNELKEKCEKLFLEIQDDIACDLDVMICHQHRRILYHMQDVVIGFADAAGGKGDIFSVLRRNWADFHDALLKAQTMAERMETGLTNRKDFMIKKLIEDEYQELIKKT